MKTHVVRSLGCRVFLVTSCFTIICVGCTAPSGGVVEEDETGPESPESPRPPGMDEVQIEFRNLSSTAVDTQFYLTNEPVEELPEELLVPDNVRRPGIGVGGTGIIGPGTLDSIKVPCSEELVVGTAGGEFLDADLGTPLGNGPVRFLQAGYQFDCGATIVFQYGETFGEYTVDVYQDN